MLKVMYMLQNKDYWYIMFMNLAQKNRLIHNAVPTLIAQQNANQSWHQKGHHLKKDVNQFQWHHQHQHHHQAVSQGSAKFQVHINKQADTRLCWKSILYY